MKLALVALCALLAGCTGTTHDQGATIRNQGVGFLPSAASNITDVGNGWATFDFQGCTILIHSFWSGTYQGGPAESSTTLRCRGAA